MNNILLLIALTALVLSIISLVIILWDRRKHRMLKQRRAAVQKWKDIGLIAKK